MASYSSNRGGYGGAVLTVVIVADAVAVIDSGSTGTEIGDFASDSTTL